MTASEADDAARNAAARLAKVDARHKFPGYPASSDAELLAAAQVEATLAVAAWLAVIRDQGLTVWAYVSQP